MCDSRAARPALFENGTGIFSGATEVALFDSDQRVTEWQPYDPDANTPVIAPVSVTQPVLMLRRVRDREPLLQVGTQRIVHGGDSVQLPDPTCWRIDLA